MQSLLNDFTAIIDNSVSLIKVALSIEFNSYNVWILVISILS